jgi:hypothetical protein
MKLFSVAVQRGWTQIARLRRLPVLLQFIYGQGPELVREGESRALRGKIYDSIVYLATGDDPMRSFLTRDFKTPVQASA